MIHTPDSHAAMVAASQRKTLALVSGVAYEFSLTAAQLDAAGLDATDAHRRAADSHASAKFWHEYHGKDGSAHHEAFLSHLRHADPEAHAHLTKVAK